MSDIKLDIPDITVVVDKGEEYQSNILPPDTYLVNVTQGDSYLVNINQSDTIAVIGSGSLFRAADFAYNAISASYALTASYVSGAASTWNTITGKPAGLVSSSTQVDYTQLQNLPSASGTASYVEYVNVANKPSLVSSSTQIDYTQIQNIPSGSTTASYVEYANVANKPTLVSSSQQITALTASLNTNQIAVTTATASISTIISSSVKRGIYSATEQIEPYIPSDIFSGVSIEYNAQRIGSIRSGIILASWSGSDVSFTDVSNTDVGETYDLSFNFIKAGSDIILRANSLGSGSGDWTVQFLFKMFPNLL